MTSTATRRRASKRSLPGFPRYEDLVAEFGFDPLEGRPEEPATDEIAAPPKRSTQEIPVVEPQTDTVRVITTHTGPSPR